jgi:hypothetical protein
MRLREAAKTRQRIFNFANIHPIDPGKIRCRDSITIEKLENRQVPDTIRFVANKASQTLNQVFH